MYKVAGIDPGLAETGWGIVSGSERTIEQYRYGNISTPNTIRLPDRLNLLYTSLTSLLTEESPDFIVVEDIFSLNRYPKSGITLGKVTGVILLAGFQANLDIEEISVREAKQVLTGNGGAGKEQLEQAVRHLLSVPIPIRPFHAADALALAIIGWRRNAQPKIKVKGNKSTL